MKDKIMNFKSTKIFMAVFVLQISTKMDPAGNKIHVRPTLLILRRPLDTCS